MECALETGAFKVGLDIQMVISLGIMYRAAFSTLLKQVTFCLEMLEG